MGICKIMPDFKSVVAHQSAISWRTSDIQSKHNRNKLPTCYTRNKETVDVVILLISTGIPNTKSRIINWKYI